MQKQYAYRTFFTTFLSLISGISGNVWYIYYLCSIYLLVILSFYSIIFYANDQNDQTAFYQKTIHELQQKIKAGVMHPWIQKNLARDLSSLQKSGVTQAMLDATMAEYKKIQLPGIIRYQIIHNKIIIKDYTNFPATMQHTLKHPTHLLIMRAFKALTNATKLPNLDFILCVHDMCTLLPKSCNKAPLFAVTKHETLDHDIIAIPDFNNGYFKSILDGTPTVNQALAGNQKYPWHVKENKAFWRGANSGGEYTLENYKNFGRVKLVEIGERYPQYLDAKFSFLYDPIPGQERVKQALLKYYKNDKRSIADHLHYKYQVYADGNGVGWTRAYWQMFSNSVILRQTSPYKQWYQFALTPYTHYIPVAENFSDLPQKIDWAKANDNRAKYIAKNANTFAQEHLTVSSMLYYLYIVLTNYAKLQRFTL